MAHTSRNCSQKLLAVSPRQGTARKGPVSAEAKSDDESSQFRNNEYLIQKVCRVSKLGGEHKQISTLQCIYQNYNIYIYIIYHTFFVFDFKINRQKDKK